MIPAAPASAQGSMRWGGDGARRLANVAGCALVCVLVAASAVVTKESHSRSGLEALATLADVSPVGAMVESNDPMAVSDPLLTESPDAMRDAGFEQGYSIELVSDRPIEREVEEAEVAAAIDPDEIVEDLSIRFFNGRPVRPARRLTMLVTAYSPDERSCGDSADGITSSIHNVWTNGMKLVAADSRILPLGSIISVPGYDDGKVVPVLDRGGAIKGKRLDVLFSSHDVALRWGSQRLEITVWEYADGQPADDYRRIRDSRN